jgi:futalosine hydrolase
MKILIVAATVLEIKPLLASLGYTKDDPFLINTFLYRCSIIDVLITGVGLMHAAYFMGKMLANNKYDCALNFGIAGSFNKNIFIGEVVHVVEERIADLGVENKDTFLDLVELHLLHPEQFPYTAGSLMNQTPYLIQGIPELRKMVKGISVNKINGNHQSIDKVVQKYHPDVESMEGAAFLYACLTESVPCLQIRSVSNYVEIWDKDTWNIPLAVENLNKTAIKIIDRLVSV